MRRDSGIISARQSLISCRGGAVSRPGGPDDVLSLVTVDDGEMAIFFCPGCECAHGPYVKGAKAWTWNGDTARPTFSPSILVRATELTPEGRAMIDRGQPPPAGSDRYPCVDTVCHSFVTDGRIQFLGDCTHALRGQTVALPPWGTS